MFLSKIRIKGYKGIGEEFAVSFNKGLNVIVGENGSGKSTILDAIRLILCEDEYSRSGISDSCFHRPLSVPAKATGADKIVIKAELAGLTENEKVAYLPWLDINSIDVAKLNLSIDNKEDYQGKYKRKVWGNESENGIFEWELLNRINCIFLPPLRDAEEKLKAYRGSRLARLLKNLRKGEDETHELEKKFSRFNRELLSDESIKEANSAIRKNVQKSVGLVFGQETSIQFTEINFNRIVERLKLLFFPVVQDASLDPAYFRELDENSLGFNNILYISTILAELDGLSGGETFHKVLLIEEPEAHLHPQLQIRLFKHLQERALQDDLQIIVTTHSPTLASAIDLDAIKVVTSKSPGCLPVFTSLSGCRIDSNSKDFLGRWLDVTKSTLLFAKAVILVEGIAEALVLKELAKIILKKWGEENLLKTYHGSLDDYGISIINMNGIYFKHFFSLFSGYNKDGDGDIASTDYVPIKCVGLTDNDPASSAKPTVSQPSPGNNPQLYLVKELEANSKNCRLFTNLKTFEYDLAMEGNNLAVMASVQLELTTTDGQNRVYLNNITAKDWENVGDDLKAEAAFWLLNHIDKGEFAQRLASYLSSHKVDFRIPQYISNAFKWVIE